MQQVNQIYYNQCKRTREIDPGSHSVEEMERRQCCARAVAGAGEGRAAAPARGARPSATRAGTGEPTVGGGATTPPQAAPPWAGLRPARRSQPQPGRRAARVRPARAAVGHGAELPVRRSRGGPNTPGRRASAGSARRPRAPLPGPAAAPADASARRRQAWLPRAHGQGGAEAEEARGERVGGVGRCGSPAAAEEGVGREGRALEAGEGGSARSRPSSSAEEGARIRYPDPLEHLEKLGAADLLELDADEAEVGRGSAAAGEQGRE